MNAITQLDLSHLQETVSSYGIGDLIRYWPASSRAKGGSYVLNTVRDGREREFILTIIEAPSTTSDAYLALLDACASAGLPVASVIRNLQGNPYDALDGNAVMLAPRLPGKHVHNPTLKQVQALARFIARAHIAAGNLHMPAYTKNAEWLHQRLEELRGRIGFGRSDLLADTLTTVSNLLTRSDVRELPAGIIHTDLFRDNVLFNERGLTGVLSFNNASDGYLIYDLAVAANDWCNDANGILDPERTLALLRAYHRIRPLTRHELWFFSGFTLYAALVFWVSRLSFTEHPETAEDVRFNNPDELQRIVEQHFARFFYLDERLLV
ncbi:MAG: homoserine kinase [Gammaproteobacteria bacterium]|nr:homoserine kinase [Gammaproteobacteria bacterium]